MAKLLACSLLLLMAFNGFAHGIHYVKENSDMNRAVVISVLSKDDSQVMYLGNEALLIKSSGKSILFDPFFHHDFGIYQKVPQDIKSKIVNASAPFENIDAVFISHAHRDHFAADEMVSYLTRYPEIDLFASNQAIEQVKREAKKVGSSIDGKRLQAINLPFGSEAWQKQVDELTISAVRIPHAGWPGRADVENLVFSVTFENGTTVMHMGDADVNISHYQQYKQHWQEISIDTNFPPYWFLTSAEGRDILATMISAKQNVGIHVPMDVPRALKSQNQAYFHQPGKVLIIK